MGIPTSNNPVLLQAQDLVVGYGRPLLPPCSLTIRAGEYWALVGPNGGGKTSLLRTLLGLLSPVSGKLSRRPDLALSYVSQKPAIDLSVPARVVDYVGYGLDSRWSFMRPGHVLRRAAQVYAALERAQALELAPIQFRELSEGQKQRVLLAQATVASPDLIALDEPTSAMDGMTQQATFALLDSLHAAQGFAVLMITHDLQRLAGRASHAVFVDKERRVLRVGSFQQIVNDEAFISRYGVAHDASPPPAEHAVPHQPSV